MAKGRAYRLLATTALTAPIILLALSAGASEIGRVAAVNPAMEGIPPQQTGRPLLLGTDVIANERVRTREGGSGQLLFVDQTTLTVAPDSNIVLDRYVFDPDTATGEVAMTVSRGLLRFIGGRITKTTEATINTPTATIGVRGGLALVMVSPTGSTRVCHLAGEYTRVRGIDGSIVNLSRPNACATVENDRSRFTGLIDSAELSDLYRRLEGAGTGGTALAAADTTAVAAVNSGDKAATTRAPISTSGESDPEDRSARDLNQPAQDDGVRAITVAVEDDSTQPPIIIPVRTPRAPPPQIVEPTPEPTPRTDDGQSNSGGEEPVEIEFFPPNGGTEINVATGEVAPFSFVEFGSLIGTSITFDQDTGAVEDVTSVEIPVPGTGIDLIDENGDIVDEVFEDESFEFLDGTGDFNGEVFASTNRPVDIFRFENGFSDIVDAETGDGTIEGVGIVEAFGPNDVDFAYIEYIPTDDPENVDARGTVLFANAAVNQKQFAEGDATIAFDPGGLLQVFERVRDPLTDDLVVQTRLVTDDRIFKATPDPSLNILANPDLFDGAVNTIDAYVVEPDLLGFTDPIEGLTPLFVVGNEGMARFESADVAYSPDLTGGGGWLQGALSIGGVDPVSGLQESSLRVLAAPIQNLQGGSGPILASALVGTTAGTTIDDNGDFALLLSRTVENLGTVEDADGNTVFGFEGSYIAVGSTSRVFGETITDPALDPGDQVDFVRIEGDDTFGPVSTFDVLADPNDGAGEIVARTNLATQDESLSERIADPLPLLGTVAADGGGATGRTFGAAFAACEGGSCGALPSNVIDGALDPVTTGLYSLRTTGSGDTGETEFDLFDNTFGLSFALSSDNAGALAGSDAGNSDFVVAVGDAGNGTGIYLDDRRFGATAIGDSARVNGAARDGDIALASSGLVGTADQVDVALADPEFVRWGWWSSKIDNVLEVDTDGDGIPDDTADRRDLAHLGAFVTGIAPDPSLIPNDVIATYAGLAIGTTADLIAGTTAVSGGNFALEYNFRFDQGSLNVTLNNGVAFEELRVDALSGNRGAFAGQSFDGSLRANGGFFASRAGDQIAGAGGTFRVLDGNRERETVGVFGGDRTSIGPAP